MSNEGYKISIIVPVYNAETYLHQCIDSIINQTHKNMEVILVNDGSTDSSPQILDNYAKDDKRVRIIHKNNGGVASARNAGLDVATGDYIAIVENDDWCELDMFESLLDSCISTGSDISICSDFRVIKGRIIPQIIKTDSLILSNFECLKKILLRENIGIAFFPKLYNAELFNDIRIPNLATSDDIAIVPKLIDKANYISCVLEPKLYYRFVETSISNGKTFTNRKFDAFYAVKIMYEFISAKYPMLSEEAFNFTFGYYMWVINMIFITDKIKFKKELTITETEIRKKLTSILKNKYISVKQKVIAILVIFKLYYPIKRLIRFIKNFNMGNRNEQE